MKLPFIISLAIGVMFIYMLDFGANSKAPEPRVIIPEPMQENSLADSEYITYRHCTCEIGVMLKHEDGAIRCTNCGRKE